MKQKQEQPLGLFLQDGTQVKMFFFEGLGNSWGQTRSRKVWHYITSKSLFFKIIYCSVFKTFQLLAHQIKAAEVYDPQLLLFEQSFKMNKKINKNKQQQ